MINAEFSFDVFDLLDINALNNMLDEKRANDEGIASNISYSCVSITHDGIITMKAHFEVVETDNLEIT